MRPVRRHLVVSSRSVQVGGTLREQNSAFVYVGSFEASLYGTGGKETGYSSR